VAASVPGWGGGSIAASLAPPRRTAVPRVGGGRCGGERAGVGRLSHRLAVTASLTASPHTVPYRETAAEDTLWQPHVRGKLRLRGHGHLPNATPTRDDDDDAAAATAAAAAAPRWEGLRSSRLRRLVGAHHLTT
jgi:hypothetical protein